MYGNQEIGFDSGGREVECVVKSRETRISRRVTFVRESNECHTAERHDPFPSVEVIDFPL